jgi:hypothetical protein
MMGSFIEDFSGLQDPRIERKKLHALMDIRVLTILCGGQRSGRLGGDGGVWLGSSWTGYGDSFP